MNIDEQRPWLKNYPKGVPANIDADAYTQLIDMVEESFRKFPKKVAFSCMGTEMTYEELDKKSNQFGAYLQSRGLDAGDMIALMMPNLLQYPVALIGALRAGLVIVNTNPLYTPREMRHQFTDSGVKAIVIAENFAANLEKVLPDTQIKTVIITSIGELFPMLKRGLTNFVVRTVKNKVPKYNIPNTVTFSEALSSGKKFSLNRHSGSANDTIFLQYTGGTTGVSKAAMLTNRNMIANMQQIHAVMGPFLKEGEEYALCPLPLYHIFALTVNCMAMMKIGAHNVLVVNPRDLSTVVKEFKRYQISLMTGVNTLFNALLNNSSFKELDFSPLKVTCAGGMALQKHVAESWHKATGCSLAEGYGLTEAAPVVTVNPLDDTNLIGTIGLPVPSTEVRIVDSNGQLMPAGEEGEIQVKGPQVMKGYYNRPEETQKCFSPDGWLRTGDIAKMLPNNFFQIIDRKKDMILVSGFNVYPNEIEEVVASHPKVQEAAAIGIPHEKSGEVVKLFVVKKDKSLTEKELQAYCRENLTGYKCPKEIEFRKDLPKSNIGKILRKDLRG